MTRKIRILGQQALRVPAKMAKISYKNSKSNHNINKENNSEPINNSLFTGILFGQILKHKSI
jgi:hypothetical protein